MARIHMLFCFTFLVASGTLLDVVSTTLLPASLPNIPEPKTVDDVEPYTVKVVMTFVIDLEKDCPKTQEFKDFFARLRAFAKYVCPISKVIGSKDTDAYESDMKAKAGSLFQAISAFADRKKESGLAMALKNEQREAMNIVGSLQSIAGKFLNKGNQNESKGSIELTAEQKQAIKDRIIRWQQVITRVVKTMVKSSTDSSSQTQTPESSQSSSVNAKGGSAVSINTDAGNNGTKGDSGKAQMTETQSGSADATGGNNKDSSNKDSAKNASVDVNGGIQGSANGSTNVVNNGGHAGSKDDKTTGAQGGEGGSTNGTTAENKGSNVNSTKDINAGTGGDTSKNNSSTIQGGAQVGQGESTNATTTENKGSNANSTKETNAGNGGDSTKDNSAGSQGGAQGSTNGSNGGPTKSTPVDNKGSEANSTTDINGGGQTNNTSVDIQGGVQGSANGSTTIDSKGGSGTVTGGSAMNTSGTASTNTSIDANISDEVMVFIINLEKKCPATEEFKTFFEKLKAYMNYASLKSSMVGKKNPKSYMSEMISIAAKLSESMALVQSRMSKSRKAKSAMQNYQQEMMKTLNVLQDVASKVVNENQSKKEGSVTVTQTQQKVIKETVMKWEQVTTQFVETAVESETHSSNKTASLTKSSSSTERSSAENRKTKSLELQAGATITH